MNAPKDEAPGRVAGLPPAVARAVAGKRVVVTGSSRGIGREIARLLIEAGGVVILNGRNPQRLDETERLFRSEFPDGTFRAVAGDLADASAADNVAADVARWYDGLDLLINNAGISMRGPIAELSARTITAMIEGNVLSALFCTRAFYPLLKAARGHVVFVSTVGAIHGFPGISVYSAAKAALERFSESWNAENRGTGLSAGVVYLGFVENDPEKEILTADGSPLHHHRKAMQTQREAAVQVISAAVRRRQRTITVLPGTFLDIARRISPGLLTWALGRSKGRIHRPS